MYADQDCYYNGDYAPCGNWWDEEGEATAEATADGDDGNNSTYGKSCWEYYDNYGCGNYDADSECYYNGDYTPCGDWWNYDETMSNNTSYHEERDHNNATMGLSCWEYYEYYACGEIEEADHICWEDFYHLGQEPPCGYYWDEKTEGHHGDHDDGEDDMFGEAEGMIEDTLGVNIGDLLNDLGKECA